MGREGGLSVKVAVAPVAVTSGNSGTLDGPVKSVQVAGVGGLGRLDVYCTRYVWPFSEAQTSTMPVPDIIGSCIFGSGGTVKVTEAVAVQPLLSVTVTV